MLNIVVLVSGGGTNLQALINAQENGELYGGRIAHVIASNPAAYALERAAANGIPASVVNRKEYADADVFTEALLKELERVNADVIVNAGFLCILGGALIRRYPNRILNVHPSLIPAFCGVGYYGLRVHEAVLASGVKLTGATVHFVTEEVDGGPILLQQGVEVRRGDTPELLQRRVMEQAEWKLLPRAVSLVCEGNVDFADGKAYVRGQA